MMTREEAIKWLEETIQDTDTYFTACSKELQKELDEQREVFLTALSALRPVSRERVEKAEWIWSTEDVYTCSSCGEKTHVDECMGNPIYNFCPFCMAPMTDEAVDMLLRRLEALHENVLNG